MQPAGQDPEARLVPGAVTLPLRSRTNASPFWIMLLLVWGRLDNGIILFGWPNEEQARSKANAVTASQTKEPFLLLHRLSGLAHASRRDLAKFGGSQVRASMMSQPCFLAVEKKERISAKSAAPCNDRKPPEIF